MPDRIVRVLRVIVGAIIILGVHSHGIERPREMMTGKGLAIIAGLALPAMPAMAQTPEYKPLEIGAEAPDFALPGATREGVLDAPLRLSDYEGKTVVLAFFYRARTKG